MGDGKGSTSGKIQSGEQCVVLKEGKITNDFKIMMREALKAQMAVLKKRVEDLGDKWGAEQNQEFINIFGIDGNTYIKLKFPFGGRNTLFTENIKARDYMRNGVTRLYEICGELSVEGDCVDVTVHDHFLKRDANCNLVLNDKGGNEYVDKDVIRPKIGNFVNCTDNDAYAANVTYDQILGVKSGSFKSLVSITIGQRFIDRPFTGENSKASTLCHELSHFIRYGDSLKFGGMWTEDMPVDIEYSTGDEYIAHATKLKNDKKSELFQNAYNIERYFEIPVPY